jgi:hypothetical protein
MRQRLPDPGLPLRIFVADDGALGEVPADGGYEIESAGGAEVVLPAEEIGSHLVHPVLAAARATNRNLMVPAAAKQAAPLIVGEQID